MKIQNLAGPQRGSLSKGRLNIDLRRQRFETVKSLQYPPLLFGKPSPIMPSISLKMRGKFARKA
jgi:hypothetical protein